MVSQDMPEREALLTVPLQNALIISDEPTDGISIFSDKQHRKWQELHGELPPLLLEFLQGEEIGFDYVQNMNYQMCIRALMSPLLDRESQELAACWSAEWCQIDVRCLALHQIRCSMLAASSSLQIVSFVV